jgi:hypothetical protein
VQKCDQTILIVIASEAWQSHVQKCDQTILIVIASEAWQSRTEERSLATFLNVKC